jgi:hypothetical protein
MKSSSPRVPRWRSIFSPTIIPKIDPANLFLQITALREAEPAAA